jgi:hypothetical protein
MALLAVVILKGNSAFTRGARAGELPEFVDGELAPPTSMEFAQAL